MSYGRWQKLAGAHVLIVGGSTGVGFAIAEGALAYHAARVTLVSKDQGRLESAIKQLEAFRDEEGPNKEALISGVACDLGFQDDTINPFAQLLDSVTDNFKAPIDHIAFTAGDNHKPRPLADVTVQTSITSAKVRYFAPLMLAKAIAKLSKDEKQVFRSGRASSFVISNGFTSHLPIEGWSQEIGFHAGIDGLARILAVEMRPVRVNSVSLGVVDTQLLEKSFPGYRDGIIAAQKINTLIGEAPSADEVAEVYLGLMKDRTTTAENVVVDGGSRFATSPFVPNS